MKSFKQSALVSFGTVINSFLGLIFYILVARQLGVAAFGSFSFFLALGILAADLGDWGIDPAIIKFGDGNLSPILSLGILQRLVSGAIIFSAALIARWFYPGDFLSSALVALSLLWFYLVTQSLLAKQHYGSFVGANIFGNVMRLVIVISGFSALFAFIASNIFALTIGAILLKRQEPELKLNFSFWQATLRQVKVFSGWTGVSFILAALASKLDSPLVFTLAGGYQTGIYSSAQKLATVFPQVASSLDSVFGPKLAAEKSHFEDYLKIAILTAMGIIFLIPFSSFIISLLGEKYFGAVLPLQILLIGMAFFILTGPFSATVLYYHGKSRIYFLSSIIQIVATFILYFFLISRFGAVGAALTFAAGSFVGLIYFMFIYRFLKNHA